MLDNLKKEEIIFLTINIDNHINLRKLLFVYSSFKHYMGNSTKQEILYFKEMLKKGLVDGSMYRGKDCLCYIGYLAKLRNIDVDKMLDKNNNKLKNVNSDFEVFLYPIRKGDTPENNEEVFSIYKMIQCYLKFN